MKSNLHPFGASGTKRVLKTDIALSLLCWMFTSPFSNWTEKYFTGTEVPEAPMPELGQAPEAIFRFVLNDDGLMLVMTLWVWISAVSLSHYLQCQQ